MGCKQINEDTFLHEKLEVYYFPSNKNKRLKLYDMFEGG